MRPGRLVPLFLLIFLAGCLGPTGSRPPLDSWSEGWTLTYHSDTGRWFNVTVLGEDNVAGFATYKVVETRFPAMGDEPAARTVWLEKQTLGVVKSQNEGDVASAAGCPVQRILPLQNFTYSCELTYGSRSFGNSTLNHSVGATSLVELPFGTFQETRVEDKAQAPFRSHHDRWYSRDIGYLTRFRWPAVADGHTEEFRLVGLAIKDVVE